MYEEALAKLETEISKKPSAELYFQKGSVHGLIAKQETPQNRSDAYQSMKSSFDSVSVYTESENMYNQKADSLINNYWEDEYTSGLAEYESSQENNLELSIAHFQNAVLLRPENIEGHKSLSIAFYNNNSIDEAISTLELIANDGNGDTEIYESLGFLYLEKGYPAKSAEFYMQANKNPVENKNIAYGLVNAYISQSNNDAASELLEKLVTEYPNDAKLHNVYGTQLYMNVADLFGSLNTAFTRNDSSSANNLLVEIEGSLEKSERMLTKAYQLENTNSEYIESLAVFYNNMSGNYFSVHSNAQENMKNEIKNKALSLTDFAINYYSILSESSPQNSGYTSKLENLNSLKKSWTEQ